MSAGTEKFGEGLVADIFDAVHGETATSPVLGTIVAIGMVTVEPLLKSLGDGASAVQIAGPYVADLLELMKVGISDAIAGKDEAQVRHDLDTAIGDLLERAKFG